VPAFDERSMSSLFDFENADTLSTVLEQKNGIKATDNNYTGPENDADMARSAPSRENYGNAPATFNGDAATAARLTTLQERNRQLQRALALASVQHSKEISAMRRIIQTLEQQVAELKAERKDGQQN
jgi:hypothetical protein